MTSLLDTPVKEHYYLSTVDRIDPEFKAKWIEALRSGKYEQGYGALETYNHKFCCLGVVCDLAELPKTLIKRNSWTEELPDTREVYEYYHPNDRGLAFGYRKSIWFVPGESFPGEEERSGFTGREVLFTCQDPVTHAPGDWSLTILNDVAKLTFDQIADIINYFL